MITQTTNVIAAGAVISPAIIDLPVIFQVLGIIWLAVQIVRTLVFWKKK